MVKVVVAALVAGMLFAVSLHNLKEDFEAGVHARITKINELSR
jgi:hypothetical protein